MNKKKLATGIIGIVIILLLGCCLFFSNQNQDKNKKDDKVSDSIESVKSSAEPSIEKISEQENNKRLVEYAKKNYYNPCRVGYYDLTQDNLKELIVMEDVYDEYADQIGVKVDILSLKDEEVVKLDCVEVLEIDNLCGALCIYKEDDKEYILEARSTMLEGKGTDSFIIYSYNANGEKQIKYEEEYASDTSSGEWTDAEKNGYENYHSKLMQYGENSPICIVDSLGYQWTEDMTLFGEALEDVYSQYIASNVGTNDNHSDVAGDEGYIKISSEVMYNDGYMYYRTKSGYMAYDIVRWNVEARQKESIYHMSESSSSKVLQYFMPSQNGLYVTGHGEPIYLYEPDTSGGEQFTQVTQNCTGGNFVMDGEWIYYIDYKDNDTSLCSVNINTYDEQVLCSLGDDRFINSTILGATKDYLVLTLKENENVVIAGSDRSSYVQGHNECLIYDRNTKQIVGNFNGSAVSVVSDEENSICYFAPEEGNIYTWNLSTNEKKAIMTESECISVLNGAENGYDWLRVEATCQWDGKLWISMNAMKKGENSSKAVGTKIYAVDLSTEERYPDWYKYAADEMSVWGDYIALEFKDEISVYSETGSFNTMMK